MQDDVSRKRAMMPSPAMVVAVIALIAALAGTAYAAKQVPRNSVGSKQLKPKSVTTGKIANGAVKSNNVVDNSLTGQDININALGKVPSAVHADQTGNTAMITGHQAACPGGTTLIRGICFDSASNSATTSLFKARDACAAKGGYLPSPLELRSTRSVLNLGTGIGSDVQFTDTYYNNTSEENKPESNSTIVIDGKGTMTEQGVNNSAEFICAYPLVR
jgi:hypothetical protein